MAITLMPSLTVLSLDSDLAGRSRYSIGTSLIRQRWSTAWMDSSVSSWNPSEGTGDCFDEGLAHGSVAGHDIVKAVAIDPLDHVVCEVVAKAMKGSLILLGICAV